MPANARTEVPRPSEFGIDQYEELTLPTPDGVKLSAFLIKSSNMAWTNKCTVLMFHGNAGNIGHRIPIAKVLEANLSCNVLMLEYRGYGLSTGDPDEKGLKIDAQVGLDYIRTREDLKNTKIIIYGQSLGGAVSIYLASKNQQAGDISALILENTFTSIAELIPSVLPAAKILIPLCHQIWDSESVLPFIKGIPILFLSGLKDEIVPPSHMKELYRICQSPNKIWKSFPDGTHNDTVVNAGYFQAIAEFMERYVL